MFLPFTSDIVTVSPPSPRLDSFVSQNSHSKGYFCEMLVYSVLILLFSVRYTFIVTLVFISIFFFSFI